MDTPSPSGNPVNHENENTEQNNTNEDAPSTAKPAVLSILFGDNSNNTLTFNLKPTTKLKKAKDVWAERMGMQRSSLRFLFDGEPVNDESTPSDVSYDFKSCVKCCSALICC